jgi:O-antigen/teichoic acid export membrane protein
MAIFSREFAALVFGNSYSYAPGYISVMSIGLLIGIAGIYASTLLISANRVKLVFKYNIMASILVLILFLLLVPKFGVWAYVGIAFILSPIISDVLFVREISGMFSIKLRYNKFARILIADMLVSAVALMVHAFFSGALMLVVSALVFVLFYPLLVTMLGGADIGDVETIKKLSKNVPVAGRLMSIMLDYAAVGIR